MSDDNMKYQNWNSHALNHLAHDRLGDMASPMLSPADDILSAVALANESGMRWMVSKRPDGEFGAELFSLGTDEDGDPIKRGGACHKYLSRAITLAYLRATDPVEAAPPAESKADEAGGEPPKVGGGIELDLELDGLNDWVLKLHRQIEDLTSRVRAIEDLTNDSHESGLAEQMKGMMEAAIEAKVYMADQNKRVLALEEALRDNADLRGRIMALEQAMILTTRGKAPTKTPMEARDALCNLVSVLEISLDAIAGGHIPQALMRAMKDGQAVLNQPEE